MALTCYPELAGPWQCQPQEILKIHLLASEQGTLLGCRKAGRVPLSPSTRGKGCIHQPCAPYRTPTSSLEALSDQNIPGRSGPEGTRSDALNHRQPPGPHQPLTPTTGILSWRSSKITRSLIKDP